MNSWQSPVTGEPSLGTPHARVTQILSTNPADTGWHSLDVVALNAAPVGVRAVSINLFAHGGTSWTTLSVSNASGGSEYGRAEVVSGTVHHLKHCIVPVDSSGCIWWKASNADLTVADITVTIYWM